MQRRASKVDETRRRIIEAAVRLHTTVGPSETSFAAVAEAAGVTRLTLYRHFATREELFAACMGHWGGAHPPPDVEAWREIRGFEGRVRRALDELYSWYAGNEGDLYPIYRDAAFTPASSRQAQRANVERMADAILADDADPTSHGLRATIGHVIGFWTWRSLAVEEGCSRSEAVDLAVGFVLASSRRRGRQRPSAISPSQRR